MDKKQHVVEGGGGAHLSSPGVDSPDPARESRGQRRRYEHHFDIVALFSAGQRVRRGEGAVVGVVSLGGSFGKTDLATPGGPRR